MRTVYITQDGREICRACEVRELGPTRSLEIEHDRPVTCSECGRNMNPRPAWTPPPRDDSDLDGYYNAYIENRMAPRD